MHDANLFPYNGGSMKITRQYMRECRACYSDEKISLLIPENGCSALDILMLDIPLKDKIWVMTRKGIIEKSIMTIWLDKLVARSKQYAADAAYAAYAASDAYDYAAYAYAYVAYAAANAANAYAAAVADDAYAAAYAAAAYAAAYADAVAYAANAYDAAAAVADAAAYADAANANAAREQEREKQVDDFIQLLKGLENE